MKNNNYSSPAFKRFFKNKNTVLLTVILLLSFVVRLFMCYFTNLPNIHTDTKMYMQQAGAILHGGYINYAPNGYPFIIALFKILLPAKIIISSLLMLNIFMGVLTVYFVYKITLAVFNNYTVAIIAAFIMAVYPNQINYTRWLLTEIPSAFFIVAAYYAYIKNKKFWSGIMFGISGIMRPTLFPVWVLMIVYDLIKKKKIPYRIIAGGGVIFILLCGFCYIKTGSCSIAGNSKVNIIYSIYSYGGDIAWGVQDQHPEIKTAAEARALYFHNAFANPGYFVKQHLASLLELWGPLPSSMKGTRSLASRLMIGAGNIFLLLFGIWAFIKNYKKEFVIQLILPFVIITIIHTMMLSIARYTIPVEPFLIIFAAWTCFAIWTKTKTEKKILAHQ